MRFVWELTEEDFKRMVEDMNSSAIDNSENEFTDDCYGFVRCGELCFDVNRTGTLQEFSLFVGGVDSGYGYSAREAMRTGKYEHKYDVPDELTYPYDHVDYYGGFGLEINKMSYDDFMRASEKKLEALIAEANKSYDKADLVEKANKPLHVW